MTTTFTPAQEAAIETIAAALVKAKNESSFVAFQEARAAAYGAKDKYQLEDYFAAPTLGKFAKIHANAKNADQLVIAGVKLANERLGGEWIVYRNPKKVDIMPKL